MNWAPVPTLKLFWPIPCRKTENHAANSLEQPAIRAKNYELVFIIYKNVAAIIPGIPQVICGWISSRDCTRFQHSFLIRHRILQENCQHAKNSECLKSMFLGVKRMCGIVYHAWHIVLST